MHNKCFILNNNYSERKKDKNHIYRSSTMCSCKWREMYNIWNVCPMTDFVAQNISKPFGAYAIKSISRLRSGFVFDRWIQSIGKFHNFNICQSPSYRINAPYKCHSSFQHINLRKMFYFWVSNERRLNIDWRLYMFFSIQCTYVIVTWKMCDILATSMRSECVSFDLHESGWLAYVVRTCTRILLLTGNFIRLVSMVIAYSFEFCRLSQRCRRIVELHCRCCCCCSYFKVAGIDANPVTLLSQHATWQACKTFLFCVSITI